MNGHERRLGRRLRSLVAGAGVVVAACAFAASALAIATVELSTSNGAAGGTVKLTMSLTGEPGDPAFAGAQVDLIIDRSQLGIDAQCSESGAECDSGLDCEDAEACGLLSCERDPRLPASLQLIANSPRFQNVPTTNKRLRLGIVGPVIPVTTFDDGVVLTCDLDVPASAGLGTQNLSTDRLVVSDENGDIIPSQVVVVPGRIVEPTELTPAVTATPTPTETPTTGPPTSTPTTTGGTVGTSTPTRTPTNGTGGGTPTFTNTAVRTATPTGSVVGSTATPTSTVKRKKGNGGCAIAPGSAGAQDPDGLIWLSLIPLALFWRRHNSHR